MFRAELNKIFLTIIFAIISTDKNNTFYKWNCSNKNEIRHKLHWRRKKPYQVLWDFGAADVDVVADGLDLLEAGLEDVDLAGHLTLTVATQRKKSRVKILKRWSTYFVEEKLLKTSLLRECKIGKGIQEWN